ncbi:MAG: hypothetical protein IPJ74_24655 [Saprospiraceae bacterium]|nr:hypothetical protein [Saprospiraceae bacterium]
MIFNLDKDLLRVYEIAFLPMFEEWIEKVNALERPYYPLNAIHFGLFEADAEDGFVVYWIGTRFYQREMDIWNKWIKDAEYEPHPQRKFLYLPFTLVTDDWFIPHSMVSRALLAYVDSEDFAFSIFRHAERITIGFDDGEVYRIK